MWYSEGVWSGIQAVNPVRTPQFAVVGLDKHQARLLPTFNRLVAAHAKSQDPPERIEGFFAFWPRPYSARSRGRKWGCSEGNRDTVCRKARGQFPNNPCGWSNHQAGGRTSNRSHDDPVQQG